MRVSRPVLQCRGKKVPKRYVASHGEFHRRRNFQKILGKPEIHRSAQKQENLRLSRSWRKQKFPVSMKFHGAAINPPKPEPTEDASHAESEKGI